MTEDEHIQGRLESAQRVYERLVAEGRWDEVSKTTDNESSASWEVSGKYG